VTWRLRIEHLTTVRYRGPVLASFNEARMTPRTLAGQDTLESRVTVGPGAVPVWTYDDYWGTIVSVFELPEAHESVVIRAVSTVETAPPQPIPGPSGRPGWAQISRQAAAGRLWEMTAPTALTTVAGAIAADAASGVAGLAPDEAAAAICARVRERISYLPGATGVRTSAQQAWDKGQGVCQDMAQVAVALLRAAGLPARYVSGYLHPSADPEPGATSAGQSHAWIEYWAGSWTPLDPTSGAPVGQQHVVVARGRDYLDVPPLKGVYRGPAYSDMDVTVKVTRLA
jgi:transglutaminase-like putative cysteine protease